MTHCPNCAAPLGIRSYLSRFPDLRLRCEHCGVRLRQSGILNALLVLIYLALSAALYTAIQSSLSESLVVCAVGFVVLLVQIAFVPLKVDRG